MKQTYHLTTSNCPIPIPFTGHVERAFRSVYTNFLGNPKILSGNFNSLNITGMVLQLSHLAS